MQVRERLGTIDGAMSPRSSANVRLGTVQDTLGVTLESSI